MKYLVILNQEGQKHTSLAVGLHGDSIEELKVVAERDYPGMAYIEADSVLHNEICQQRAYWDGERVVIEPLSDEEIEAARVNALNTERAGYENELHERLKVAELQGDPALIASIRDEYVAMNEAYVEALKGAEA